MPDYLCRQPYLDLLKSIIANQCGNPSGYSFAIDGEWGSGKTWILQELENQLLEDSEHKYLIFHYNAWENDFYEEPLVAILSVMIESLEDFSKAETIIDKANAKLLTTAIKIFKNLAISIVNTQLLDKTGLDCREVIDDFRDVGDSKSTNDKMKTEIDSFISLKNVLSEIRNQINNLSQKVTVLLIVDELDCCLPEYAIKVLERLHHVCTEMPVIQILAINKNQLSNSISKVFGMDSLHSPNQMKENIQFSEIYLQKFVDVIIPLPNSKVDARLEVLNGLEKSYSPHIRKNMLEQDFIKVDETFLAEFVSTVMNGIERRLQEKIFKQVELCHKLTIQSGIKHDKENITYAFLIYEIISCICRFVFHLPDTCKIRHEQNTNYVLEFYLETNSPLNPYKYRNRKFNANLKQIFSCPPFYTEDSNGVHRLPFEIRDTKSYIMAFFAIKPKYEFVTFESHIWDWIEKDKVFLKKYDEIMDILVAK